MRFAHASRCQKIASRVEPCVHALLLTHTPKEPKERTQFGGAAKKWHRTRERARARARIVPNVLEVGWRVSMRGNSRTITQSARRDCSGSGVRELQRRDAATREGATFFLFGMTFVRVSSSGHSVVRLERHAVVTHRHPLPDCG